MTDRADALRALIERVEAGKCPQPDSLKWYDGHKMLHGPTCYSAFHGSLDAAISLHEAVLPGYSWGVNTMPEGYPSRYEGSVWSRQRYGLPFLGGDSDQPGRALLLAILRALRAKADD